MDVLTAGAVAATCLTTIICASLSFARRALEIQEPPHEEEEIGKLRDRVMRLARLVDETPRGERLRLLNWEYERERAKLLARASEVDAQR
ncbi:MAG TPA: hypothetical protein VF765_31155 [Polyangiaceae bacterium]